MSVDVQAGSDGWLFLTGGEHSAIDLYQSDSSFTPELAKAWVALLRGREEQLASRGIKYVHLAVPDKLTLLNRHYTDSLANTDGSPIRQLHARHEAELSSFLNVVPYLTQGIEKYPVFWKTDNHWTAWGCFMAYQLLCSRLHIPTNTDILNYPYTEASTVMALAQSVSVDSADAVEPETVRTYQLDRYSKRVYANELVRFGENINIDRLTETAFDASGAGDQQELKTVQETLMNGEGSHVIYENTSESAVDKVVVLFGDSYSDYQQNLLTGMLAETVKELHFVWSHSVDHEYVRQVRPDIVISQSTEASMTQIPCDTGDLRSRAAERLHAKELAVATVRKLSVSKHNQPSVDADSRQFSLLGKETYNLNPPVVVQPGWDKAHQELVMQTNPVSLLELDYPKVFFNGSSCLLRSANGRNAFSYGVDASKEAELLREDYLSLPGTTFLLAPSPGAHCYYHWMLDILPKLGLLERQGISLDSIDHFLVREITSEFQRETLAALGIHPNRIVETVSQQFWNCEKLIHIDMNNGINLKMNRFVPLWLKQTFLSPPEDTSRLRLYISRPEGVRRGILNEDAVKPLVEAAGFTVVAMEGMSVAEQAALLSRADALMAPHGGALTNMVFCKPGIPVIELLSRHVYPYYYGLSELCGHRYHAILQDPVQDFPRLVNYRISQAHAAPAVQWRTQNESFDVDLAAVEQILQKLPL